MEQSGSISSTPPPHHSGKTGLLTVTRGHLVVSQVQSHFFLVPISLISLQQLAHLIKFYGFSCFPDAGESQIYLQHGPFSVAPDVRAHLPSRQLHVEAPPPLTSTNHTGLVILSPVLLALRVWPLFGQLPLQPKPETWALPSPFCLTNGFIKL